MKKNLILFSLGILAVLLIAAFGPFKEYALWGLLLFPLFFIGEPWYRSLKRTKAVSQYKEDIN